MKEHKEPHQYLLFIFGEFKNNDKLVNLSLHNYQFLQTKILI